MHVVCTQTKTRVESSQGPRAVAGRPDNQEICNCLLIDRSARSLSVIRSDRMVFPFFAPSLLTRLHGSMNLVRLRFPRLEVFARVSLKKPKSGSPRDYLFWVFAPRVVEFFIPSRSCCCVAVFRLRFPCLGSCCVSRGFFFFWRGSKPHRPIMGVCWDLKPNSSSKQQRLPALLLFCCCVSRTRRLFVVRYHMVWVLPARRTRYNRLLWWVLHRSMRTGGRRIDHT